MKESLRELYLDNNSSKFQHLLGFTEVSVDIVDAEELDLNEENRPEDSKDDIHEKIWDVNYVNRKQVTNGEEQTNGVSENTIIAGTLECSLCEFKGDTGKTLKQHKLNFHRGEEKSAEKSDLNEDDKEKQVQQFLHCGKCDEKFRQGGAFRRHKLVNHDEKKEEVEKEWESLQQNFQWKCEVCAKRFFDQHNLRVHARREHPSERSKMTRYDTLQCVKCARKFRHGAAFRQHKIIKHSENEEEVEREWETLKESFKWKCEVCEKKFLDQHNLRVHMKREHPVKRIKDEQEKYEMRREKNRIRSKRKVVCEQCSKSVKATSLKSHLKAHERNDFAPQKNFDCTMCVRGKYKSDEALQRHVERDHSGLEYPCKFCDHISISPAAKSSHNTTQHGTKTLPCKGCDKIFSSNSYLNSHVRTTHEKVKNKQCPHCGEAFQASSAFKAHVNRHTDNRQFSCETCGKAFLVDSHLKEHAKRHTRPYFCDQCDIQTGSNTSLKRHKRIAHEQQQIECRHGCGWKGWETISRGRHEKPCKLNPLPNAPYTVSVGIASSFTLQVKLLMSGKVERLKRML